MKVQGGNFMLNGFIYAKTDFGPPPPGYVPGLGRGAVGFITGNDVGDAIKGGGADDNLNDNQYDNWNGYQGSLFNNGDYDDEDKQADKLNLGGISHDEWEGIPDATDRSIKKVKKERIVPVPDSLIESSRKDMEMSNSINVAEGTQSSMMGNLNDIGTARGTILASKLDKQSEQVDGIRTVDKKGILTELSSVKQISEAEVGDYDRVRKIIKSLINKFGWRLQNWRAR
ncbi:hypothetical protein PPERSA_03587 [Pseudocohnilembus persalinus]|uniref:PRP1 splicing factor N-terminal domain-containing protein n=1 Tax=Pseudocohnilembus persalinus TaxID=266149 RepID=A0A0V0QPY1_PSEPJ|nr:hypothetical protein PPERSA_03587 [Pseudocohnilembus persalinus]|eukprot:KRX04347.1 hypothetical protein PPERSA_03587 [Pseudocohnilembus persalinus]